MDSEDPHVKYALRTALLAIAMQIADTSVPVIRLASWVDWYMGTFTPPIYLTTQFIADAVKLSLVSYGIPIRAGYV